jgi:hypothetical protein
MSSSCCSDRPASSTPPADTARCASACAARARRAPSQGLICAKRSALACWTCKRSDSRRSLQGAGMCPRPRRSGSPACAARPPRPAASAGSRTRALPPEKVQGRYRKQDQRATVTLRPLLGVWVGRAAVQARRRPPGVWCRRYAQLRGLFLLLRLPFQPLLIGRRSRLLRAAGQGWRRTCDEPHMRAPEPSHCSPGPQVTFADPNPLLH